MKAVVNTSLLAKELKKVSSVISKNTIIPILSCVKLSFSKERLTIMASDLETTYVSSLECNAKEAFTTIADFHLLSDACNSIPDQPVTFEVKDKSITIISDDSKFKFQVGGTENEFPKMPEHEYLFTVDVGLEFFLSLKYADSCKNSNNVMTTTNTACLDFKKTHLSVVGTDALVMYKKDFQMKSPCVAQCLVRGKFIDAVKNLGDAKLSVSQKFLKAESGDITIITLLQDNAYCNYGSVLPENPQFNLKASRQDLFYKLSRAAVAANATTRMCALVFSPDELIISSKDFSFEKEGECRMKVVHNVEIDAVGVNAKQLLHVLEMLDSDDVELSITSATRSMYIRPVGDKTTICLLQPLTLD